MAVSAKISDEGLASRANEGDQEAFAALYERYVRGVYDFSARMVRSQDLADDVVQSTFANAWQALRKRRVTGNIKAWLYTIARNNAINELRRRKRVIVAGEGPEEGRPTFPYTEVDAHKLSDPESILQDQELVDLVWESAAALSAKEYSLLDLHLRKGLSPNELAETLGVRRGNIYTMLSRLRDSLEESVTAALLMRHGRRDCPELEALLSARRSLKLDRGIRRSILSHSEECSRCQESRRRYVAPAEIFSGLAVIPVSEESRAVLWQGISATLAAGGVGAGFLSQTAQQAIRWWADRARPVQAAAVAGSAAVVGVVVTALILLVVTGGGLSIRDPGDVRSTSHQVGQPSSDRVIVIVWSRQPDAAAYSVRWSQGSSDIPDTEADLAASATSTRSPPLDEGAWYFHLRTRGKEGGWTSTVHLGPFIIEPPGIIREASSTPTPAPDPAPSPTPTAGSEVAGPTPTPMQAVAGDVTGPTPTPVPTPSVTPSPTPAPAPTATPVSTPIPTASPTPTPTSMPRLIVSIDIVLGDSLNIINLDDGEGVIQVAILTTDFFDAANVGADTVMFSGASPIRSVIEDVDKDEDLDLVLHFVTQETNIAVGDTKACLQGETVSGEAFEGCDSIRTVPSL